MDKKNLVNSISFHEDGLLAVTAGENNQIRLYNIGEARQTKVVLNKQTGTRHLRYTHHDSCVIYASNNVSTMVTEKEKRNDTSWSVWSLLLVLILLDVVIYHSLKDNRCIRIFEGHTDEIVSLEMSPQNDTFMTASLDHTVRLWYCFC